MTGKDANLINPSTSYVPCGQKEPEKTRPKLVLQGEDPRPDSDYDPDALKKGMNVESEHSDDPAIQKFITKDYLDEDPKYYEKNVE